MALANMFGEEFDRLVTVAIKKGSLKAKEYKRKNFYPQRCYLCLQSNIQGFSSILKECSWARLLTR